MNLSEQDARALQALHFYWNEKDRRFFRDWKLPGNDYMEFYFDEGIGRWILFSHWETGEDEGYAEDYVEFDSVSELLEYFKK